LHDYAQRIEAALGPMETAHWMLDRNDLAMTARLALDGRGGQTRSTSSTIWQNDERSAACFASTAAANRGVKIRILLDDFSASSNAASSCSSNSHPNACPFVSSILTRDTRFGTAMEFLSRAKQLNPRMHNKTYIADNRFAVIRGRNIGDRYFGLYAPFVQNDLDVLLAGELVGDVTASFDSYWNSVHTYPVAIFPDHAQGFAGHRDDEASDGDPGRNATLLGAFPCTACDWSEFRGSVGRCGRPRGAVPRLAGHLERARPDSIRASLVRRGAQREVLISSPYFIPDLQFLEIIRTSGRAACGSLILTNSLATNNHVVAHTG
jgi:putative cardiolipin synthase